METVDPDPEAATAARLSLASPLTSSASASLLLGNGAGSSVRVVGEDMQGAGECGFWCGFGVGECRRPRRTRSGPAQSASQVSMHQQHGACAVWLFI